MKSDLIYHFILFFAIIAIASIPTPIKINDAGSDIGNSPLY